LALVLVSLALTGTAAAQAASAASLPAGSVVWWDLLTKSPTAVLDFYRELVGWEISEHTDRHWVIFDDGRPIAGISRIRDDNPDVEQAFWLAGIAVGDVDAATDEARRLGAKVHVEPADSAGYARYAVIADPEGVPVMLLRPIRSLGSSTGPGSWAWAELWARRPDEQARFYERVVGYQRDRIEIAGSSYEVLSTGGERRAGLLRTPSEQIAPAWAPYLEVAGLEATLARVTELGGSILVEPRLLQSVGSVALIADPAGAALFLYERPSAEEVTR
jgi:predicted enzyme related to lactoylglutathione lyase